jgi:hypothetical protein
MMEREARGVLKSWKTELAGGVYYLLVGVLSFGLLRARVRCFEPSASKQVQLELHSAVRPEMQSPTP